MTRTKSPKPPLLMTQAAYARHRIVKRQYIGKLVKNNVLTLQDRHIDVAASDAILDDRADFFLTVQSDDPTTGVKLADARLQRELYVGKLQRLEFEAKSGTLIPAEQVIKRWTSIAAMVKTKLEAVPSKLAPRIAAISDVRQCRELLAKEVKTILSGIASEVRNGH